MINFTFSLRLRLVDLLILYVPAYFFTNRVMYARQQMLQFCVCLFSFKEFAWPGMSCDNLTAWGHWFNPTLCIIMSLYSFASLVDRACAPSAENPNAVRGDRDVKAHLKSCNNILTDIESIDSERKLLLARAGESTGKVTFSVIERRLTCKSYKLLTHLFLLLWGIFVAQECQLHMTVCPKHRDANGIRWRTGRVMCCVSTEVAGHKSASNRGDRAIDCKQSCFILQETGILVPAESVT